MTVCPDCGARYDDANDFCRARFDALLALDHSRREPWGSRHGLAFAAFALQHPSAFAASLDRSWSALHAIFVVGHAQDYVFRTLVANKGAVPREWNTPARPSSPQAVPSCTIADLDDFAAATYPERIEHMCRAALVMWGLRQLARGSDGRPFGTGP
jgi:hypothetical protein